MRNPTALAALFLTLSLSVSGQGIVIDPPTLHRWAANRALADTLLDEAEGNYQSARRIINGLRADLDTCSSIAQRSNERFDAATFELEMCQEQLKESGEKVKRLRVWAWISRIGLAVGAVFAVKELVDTAKP